MARAIWDELLPHLKPDARPPSASFMNEASRLSRTGHENRLSQGFLKYGLAADLPTSYIDVGLRDAHPIIHVHDFVKTLADNDKLDLLYMGNSSSVYVDFWERFRLLQPRHPIFEKPRHLLGSCIPIAVHADEGTTLKKKSLMILQWQPILGRGSRKRRATQLDPGCNMFGHSLTTRYLFSVMLGRLYGQKNKNRPLLDLVDSLAADLAKAFDSGIKVGNGQKIFLVPLAMKGDWPALAKIGTLVRHFGCVSAKLEPKQPPKGICHLCKADQVGHRAWHNVGYKNMMRMREGGVPLPWSKTPSLVNAVKVLGADQPKFFKVDAFHTLHKGVFSDVCANTIAQWLHVLSFGFFSDLVL